MSRGLFVGLVLAALTGPVLATPAAAQRRIPINIESVPAGATVYLDNAQGPPLGQTPLRNARIPVGDHTFIFRLANHEEARLAVTVRRRRETFRAVLRSLGVIEVSAGNEAARGATVRVDGREVGGGTLQSIPIRVTDLQPGRTLVTAEREGYVTFEQWVEVSGGQIVRVPVLMERAAPDTGSILVGGSPGAQVLVDGTPVGTSPMLVEDVAVGPHTVEVRSTTGGTYTTSVTVLAGQRVSVTPTTGATLRVLASVPNAIISIDGEVIGPSPAVREGLAAGEHIITATAEGYGRLQETVTIEAGQQRVVSLDMRPDTGQPGQIIVQANVSGARVFIDGEDQGTAPVVATPPAGDHAIVVRADGHQEYATTCEVGPGQDCEISAVLGPEQVRVSVAVQEGVTGAEILVDGEVYGPVPFEGTLPAGSHEVEIRAPGYEPLRQRVLLTPSSETRPFDVTLREAVDGLTEEERREREALFGSTVTHAAAPLLVDHASMDISLGWPYLAELRLHVGLLEWLDAGFATRVFERIIEFEGRAKFGIRPIRQASAAIQVRFGGGIWPSRGFGAPQYEPDPTIPPGSPNPPFEDRIRIRPSRSDTRPSQTSPTNTFFFSTELLGSLHFSSQGAFTLFFGVDLSTDEYAGHPLNSGVFLDYQANGNPTCSLVAEDPALGNCGRRQTYARARLGGVLELVLTRSWNLWFLLEGIVSAQPRNFYGNLLGIQTNDTQFYFRLGTTYKF
ncbi:MAG: PEGA domain-containing protein [Sandaracinaceae bacterium]